MKPLERAYGISLQRYVLDGLTVLE